MKATDVIKRDHRAAKDLFDTYKKASHDEREAMIEDIFAALDTHEKMEDTYFYPALQGMLDDEDAFAELELEQTTLAEELEELRSMTGDRDDRILVMMDRVLEHAKKEEHEVLDKADKLLSKETLEELGEKMEPMSAVALSKK
jgi:hypothetical protein